MRNWPGARLGLAALAVSLLGLVAGCGDDSSKSADTDSSGTRGSLIYNPPLRIAALTAADFTAQLNSKPEGQALLALTGTPVCGVDFHYIEYGTVGGNAASPEATTATGALMIPTGSASQCTGARPIVLYAHGTTTDRNYNIADITNPNNTEGTLLAAFFAAQGYIVVAPNYAGYDKSPLPYHPYLNADQSSKEMIDALTAARRALGSRDNGRLFVTGYSQGGHVAMATVRAMQAASMTVTASAPMSGPYALSAFGDALVSGNVNLGSTVFTPLISTSYQRAYGNIYSTPNQMYEDTYANGIESLLPSTSSISAIFGANRLPQTALFNSTPPQTGDPGTDALLASITPPTTPPQFAPLFALGFGTPNLIRNSYRLGYLQDALARPDGAVPTVTTGLPPAAPTHPLRQAFKTNDMRNPLWAPATPMLLCGGSGDSTVFYSINTSVMQGFWGSLPVGRLSVLDIDGSGHPLFGALQTQFDVTKAATAAAAVAAGATDGGQSAVIQAYHGGLVPPFCTAAVRAFFAAQR